MRTFALALLVARGAAFVHPAPLAVARAPRAPPAVASAKILPAVYTAAGAGLLRRGLRASNAEAAVLGATGLLAVLNLAVTDNQAVASGKRALAVYEGKTGLPGQAVAQKAVAAQWYRLVALRVVGQLAGLGWMLRAADATGVLRGAAFFMAANVAYLLCGAGNAKHDASGLPAPLAPALQRTILAVDTTLYAAAFLGSAYGAGSGRRALASYVFAAGALVGAAEGAPKWAKAVQGLVGAGGEE